MSSILTEQLNGENLAIEGKQVPIWIARPYQLVSLLDMYKYHPEVLFNVSLWLENFRLSVWANEDQPMKEETKEKARDRLGLLIDRCQELDLNSSAVFVAGLLQSVETPTATVKEMKSRIPELQNRIHDELESVLFLYVPKHEANYFQKKQPFGELVENKFPETAHDIEEAGKCIALSRSTAAVFHLMRVMEKGLQYFGKKLRVKLPQEKVWQDILNRINGKVSRMRPRAKKTIIYADLAAHLYNVKVAWRNPVMHPKESYTPEEAQDVFSHVNIFMRHLADNL